MLSQTAEYAMRAMVHLGRIGGGPAVADEIAAEIHVPAGYLSRVLRMLVRAGLLKAQRGIGGGFSLAMPTSQLSVWDVLEATDSTFRRVKGCPLGMAEHGTSLCGLHRLLDDVMADAETRLREATILDVIANDRGHPPCSTGTSSTPDAEHARQS